MIYCLDTYSTPDTFLDGVKNDVPDSLQQRLNSIIKSRKCFDDEKYKTNVLSIAHSIITATRPRSFLSPIQIGLGTLIYKKYGSKDLLDIISTLGFCSSYNSIRLFEMSCIQHPPKIVMQNSFCEFVFDNADVNIDTIDGLNTFHAMGCIQCLTPFTSVSFETNIKKTNKILAANAIKESDHIDMHAFQRTAKEGLSSIEIVDVSHKNPTNEVRLFPSDFLWI